MSDIRVNRWLHQSGTGGVYQDSSGRVGIGTSVPTSSLDVQSGTIKIGNNTLSSSGVSTFTNLVVSAGSTSAPSISPTGDSNTGIFFPSPDTVAIAEGGVEVLRVDSSGNFGVGTISPSNYANYKTLEVNGTTSGLINLSSSGQVRAQFLYDGSNIKYDTGLSATEHIFLQAGTERARFTSSGLKLPSGLGIDFSATANSSGTMTSELLSDYEEGTFSPFSAADVTNRGISIPNQAVYVKIGRICHIWFRFSFTNSSSSAQITGNFPFVGSTPSGDGNYSPFFLSVFPKAGSPSHMGFCYNNALSSGFALYQNNASYVTLNWNSGCTEYTVIGAYQTVS